VTLTLSWRVAGAPHSYDLTGAEQKIIVGRSKTCDVVINHRTVSRRHAEIIVDNEAAHLHSLTDRNIIYVNEQPVEKSKPVTIRPGDKVKLGAIEIQIGPDIAAGGDGVQIKCYNCGRLVVRDYEYCPWCGTLLSGQSIISLRDK